MNKLTDDLVQLKKTDFELTQKGICPACNVLLSKHTKQKNYVCLNIMRKKYNLPIPMIEKDGKKYEVRITKPTKTDFEKAGYRNE